MLRNLHSTRKLLLLHLLHSNSLLTNTCKFATCSEPNPLFYVILKWWACTHFITNLHQKTVKYISKVKYYVNLQFSFLRWIHSKLYFFFYDIHSTKTKGTISCLCLNWDVNKVKWRLWVWITPLPTFLIINNI